MGLEKACDVRFDGKTFLATAHLEPSELRIRGALKVRVSVGEVKSAEARAGILKVKWPGGVLDLHLGPDAERWALKIRYPKGRLDKLGIKPGMRVAVLGLRDEAFLKELRERTDDVALGKARTDTEAVVVALAKAADLEKLGTLRRQIVKHGMIWAVWPKGRKEFREDDVRSYGPRAGLVDVKVMSFSDTLSALKLVIPLKDR